MSDNRQLKQHARTKFLASTVIIKAKIPAKSAKSLRGYRRAPRRVSERENVRDCISSRCVVICWEYGELVVPVARGSESEMGRTPGAN